MTDTTKPNGAIDRPGHNALSEWFSLSYSSFLTLPRVLMEAMPDEWQGRMAALLEEYDDAYTNWPDIRVQVRITDGSGRMIKTPRWLINYRHPDRAAIEALRGAGEEA